MLVRAHVDRVLFATLLLGCGETGSAGGTTTAALPSSGPPSGASGVEPGAASDPASAGGAPHPLPATIVAEVTLPGPSPGRHLSVGIHLDRGLPWEIVGCVMPDAAPCEETMDVELDDTARGELVRAIEEVRSIPRCEPEGIFPDDRGYELSLTGFERPYGGHLPADASTMAVRNAGPCRADARLVWWIVTHFDPAASATAAPEGLPMPSVPES